MTPPQVIKIEENDVFTHESFGLVDAGDGLVPSFLTLLGHYSDKMERRERQILAEQRRNDERVQKILRDERDSALSELGGQRALATTSKKELEAEIAKNKLLVERVETLERQLAKEQVERNKMEGQMAENAAQLSDAATQSSKTQDLLNSIWSALAKKENENIEIREELVGKTQQLDRANALIAEERAKSDRTLSELTSVETRLAAEQSQRSAVEHQLKKRDKKLTRIHNRLVETRAKNSELHLELAQARTEAEAGDTLRSANKELEAKCETLAKEVSDLHDIRRRHECTIKNLEEQQLTTSRQVDHLGSEIQDEQKRSTELRSTVSGLEVERDKLIIQIHRLQAEHDNLATTHAAVRRAEIGMRMHILSLQARCGSLNAVVAELRSITSQLPKAEAKLPRCPAMIKYRSSRPKL
ncbi:hypothetical protein BDW75DRAFT_242581 [Aspergillus navahoensis]